MNFGFVTGDETVNEPYFYITAYPLPEELPKIKLPAGVQWKTEGFNGAVLKYEELTKSNDPKSLLMDYLKTVQGAGSRIMLG
ncbi:MAG: hypothetical protein GY940_13195 [bacterium]|nr:hypothetical protein [bacterium]